MSDILGGDNSVDTDFMTPDETAEYEGTDADQGAVDQSTEQNQPEPEPRLRR